MGNGLFASLDWFPTFLAAAGNPNIVDELKTGKHMGTARDILPPMPWNWYGQLSEDDLKAIYAYLLTIPPIVNHVPDPLPPAGAAAN